MENLPIRALESGGYFCENIQQMRAAAERSRVLRPALLERKSKQEENLGFFLTVLLSMIQFIWLPGTSTVSMVTKVIHNINAVHFMLQWNFPMQIFQTTVKYRFH